MTPAELTALRAAINAVPALTVLPKNGDTDLEIAAYFNEPSSPEVRVWNPVAPVRSIMDTFNWAAFTPADSMPESNVDTAAIQRYTARLLAIQTKQINLQLMLQGRETVDATLDNFRTGLRDALVAVPAGVGGAGITVAGANASNALNACTRVATRGEVVFADPTPKATGVVSARIMNYVGAISPQDVANARAN